MPHKTEEDLSETKSISAKNKKIQIALGICLAPCIGAEEIDFLHMIFFRERSYQYENSKYVFFWASSEAKRTTVREISLWREPTHSSLDFLDILPDLADDPSWAFPITRIRVILIDSPLSLSTSSIFPK